MTQGDRDQRQKQAGHRDSAQPCDGFSESPSSWNTLHESQTAFLPDWRTDDVESLRPFADIRLIAADLDGTLLPDARSNLAPAIQRLQRSLFYASPHVRLTIATGRAYAGTASLAADLRIDKETPLIVYNGSLIVQPRIGRGMRQGFIRREALRQIVSTCLLHNATVLAYSHQSPLALDLALIDERVYG